MAQISRLICSGLAVVLTAAWLVFPAGAANDDDAAKEKLLALNHLTGTDTINGRVRTMVAEPADTKKLLPVAVKLAKEKEPVFNYNAAYILARTAADLKDVDSAEPLYRVCTVHAVKLQSGQKLAESFGGLIDLFYEHKQFEKTEKLCQEFLELNSPNDTVERLKEAVYERMIQAIARQGKVERALKLVEKKVKEEEESGGWYFLQLKASLLREADKAAESAEAYETVIERLGKDKQTRKELRERFLERNRYLLSGVYIDLKKVDKASEQLEALLKEKPDDATYNNDLGYIWADHNMKLDEAEKLIRKALAEDLKQRKKDPDYDPKTDKDNAAYLDSLGWVLFKQKKLKEAKEALQKAVKDKEGQHIEIYDHLGDVLQALGEKDEAIAIWKKGVESVGAMSPATKREKDRKAIVEKKIKEQGEK